MKGNNQTMTNAERKDLELQQAARQHGISLSLADARILRRAEMTLHRWDEQRCGWSTPGPYGASIALVRDEDGDGLPYLEIHPNGGANVAHSLKTRWERVPDRERGALKRIKAICKKYAAPNGSPLKYYHQSDPRGAALYIWPPHYRWSPETNYRDDSFAVCCAVR
jgi:hypothetical protein